MRKAAKTALVRIRVRARAAVPLQAGERKR